MSSDENLRGAQEPEERTRKMKICDENVAPVSSETDRTPILTQNPTQQTSSAGPYSSYYSDPLAADEPGEELLPGAAVWTIYKKEAVEYDNELVKGRNENLDTMLLFAALFSAILTAFLIESTSLLQEDHAETSAALLLLLVQSNLGATNLSSALPGASSFTPDSSARWVNGLWFAALSLSLAATLLAMLAKEWLDAFNASHKRAPHAYAISRQARLDGFEAWGAPHIMDLLPTLLHLSLLLFALGLVVYLWRLDQAVAIMLSFIIGVTCLLYLGTVVCGAVYEFCPFITRLSRYLQVVIRAVCRVKVGYCNDEPSDEKPDFNEELTAADLRALMWLAKHARDQESGNSAYQALAGLGKRKMKSLLACGTKRNHQKVLEECGYLAHFLKGFATCFESAMTKSPRELAQCRGENIVRYTQALPGIVNCVGTLMDCLYQVPDQRERTYALMQLGHPPGRVMDSTLKLVDEIWSGRYELNASTYAYVTASELRYVKATIANEIPRKSSEPLSLNQTPDENKSVDVVLDLPNKPRTAFSSTQLWARYEASLGCASFLIYLHQGSYSSSSGERRVSFPMEGQALLDLLEAIETTATFMLKLPAPYSQSSRDRNITYTTRVSSDLRGINIVTPQLSTNVGELLGDLLRLSSTPQPGLASTVRHASARAMSAVGLLNAQGGAQSDRSDFTSWEKLIHVDVRYGRRDTVLKAIMDLVFFAALRDPLFGPLDKILDSLLNLIKYMDSIASSELVDDLRFELVPMMRLTKASMESWPGEARSALIRVLAFELTGPVKPYETKTVWANACSTSVEEDPQALVSWLLRIIERTSECRNEVKILFVDLVKHFDEYDSPESDRYYRMAWALDHPYLRYFTQTPGFHELVEVGHNADYIPLVAQTIIRICANSHFQQARSMDLQEMLMTQFQRVELYDLVIEDEGKRIFKDYEASPLVPHPQTISPIALPGFLDAVTLALDVIQSDKLEEPADIPQFVGCAMKLLNVSLIASHGGFDDECGRKAGEVARRLCERGAPELEIEAVGVIAQYGQYCELPAQTEDEITILEDQSANDELDSLRGPTAE